ncbi:MAG: hypothetical protein ACOX5R_18285 [bacterium]
MTFAQPKVFPEGPILVFPPKGAQLQINEDQPTLLFTWEPVSNANYYQIVVGVGIAVIGQGTSEATSTSLQLDTTAIPPGSTISWTVRALQRTNPPLNDRQGAFSEPNTFTLIQQTTNTPIPSQNTPTPSLNLIPPQLEAPDWNAQFTFEEAAIPPGIEFRWRDVTSAARYQVTIYPPKRSYDQTAENQYAPIQEFVITNTTQRQFTNPIQEVYQWEVRSIDVLGNTSHPSERRSFTIGTDLPTPTPHPTTADLDNNSGITAEDVYHFAQRFRTNDLEADFNQNQITDPEDLLEFIHRYRNRSNN